MLGTYKANKIKHLAKNFKDNDTAQWKNNGVAISENEYFLHPSSTENKGPKGTQTSNKNYPEIEQQSNAVDYNLTRYVLKINHYAAPKKKKHQARL